MGPAVRARNVRDALNGTEAFAPGTRVKILERMPDGARKAILETPSIGWVPVEYDHWVPGGVRAVLGEEDGHEYFRTFLPGQLDGPMLGTIVQASKRLFGTSPATMVWATERAWHLVYRDFCVAKAVERGDGFARLELRDIHPHVLEYDAYPFSFRAFFEGFLIAFRTEGETHFQLDRANRLISVNFRW